MHLLPLRVRSETASRMKKLYTALLGILLSCPAFTQAYRVPLKLTDSAFIINSVYTAHIDMTIDNRDIREESKPTLDSIADFMLRHPELIIELGSYTDQRGSDSANLVLSQARANKVKDYLVKKGIYRYALPAVGYGESSPVVPQSVIDRTKGSTEQEDLYQRNRRYEFKILNIYRNGYLTLTDTAFFPGEIVRLDVLYDLGKPTLRPESYPLIDSLAKFLIAHPELTVEIGNHTDTRGSDAMNIKLTDARSRSVVDRLLLDGVPASQVLPKGYGESQTLVTEAYVNAQKPREAREQLHTLNRRTELKILSVNK